MKRSNRFGRRSRMGSWVAMTAAILIVGTQPTPVSANPLEPASGVSQADGEKSDTTEPVQERVFSGPQPGEEVKPFKVLHVKADDTKELEIVKDTDDRVTLICFVHRLSNDDRILFGLGLVDFYASRHKALTSHFVLLSDERAKMTTMLRGWARGPVFKNAMVSLSADGREGPGYYGLNRNVAMTVVVAKGDKVVGNLVFQAPNANDLQKIMAAVAKALGEPEPALAKVQQELRAERQRQAEKRIKASPVFKLAPNEQLGRIMFGLVNSRGNRSLNAKRRSQQLQEWAGDSIERNSDLKKYCKAVLAGDFQLDRYAREAVKKFAGENSAGE